MVKGRKPGRKLTVRKEKIRNLMSREVEAVRGGGPFSDDTGCDTCDTDNRTGGDTCSCGGCADLER